MSTKDIKFNKTGQNVTPNSATTDRHKVVSQSDSYDHKKQTARHKPHQDETHDHKGSADDHHNHDGHHHRQHDEPGHHNHSHSLNASRKALFIALLITTIFLVVEAVVGFLINSLALIADAGHMLTDAAALALGLIANLLAGRHPNAKKTFGYSRFEILAALLNGLTLVGITVYIFWEAFNRWNQPAEIEGGWLIGVAFAGLIANLVSAYILMRGGSEENLNVRGALLHVLGDALGSVGAIVAGLVILLTGWYTADTIVSVVIGLLVLFSSLRLLRESVNILLEATPRGMDLKKIEQAMQERPGVEEVHDLHVWMISNGFIALSGHVLTDGHHFNSKSGDECGEVCESHQLLIDLHHLLETRFNIQHITLQLEERSLHDALNNRCYQTKT